ncbi:MAG TPA: Fe(3+) ABC transporter substrate-binding protein [Burkholderiales bacterium]|nr:Fe(3+) ABC transporter substrate-binding protein [Burkholderiales bacterium]
MNAPARYAALALFLLATTSAAVAQEKVLNIYSSRHYQTDEALYSGFTAQTGIKINRIEAAEDPLIERIRNEGEKSPADVLITVDAGRLWRAEQLGLFQPVKTPTLDSRIPANFREPNGMWYGFSMRARVIAYDKARVKPEQIQTYATLADPKWAGKVCVRSSSHIYNLSLLSAMIETRGEAKATEWAKGVKANLAREPKGGDTDQIKGVAAGECELALVNHYYYARLVRSTKTDEQAIAEKVGVVFPNANEGGTHVNISGAGVLKHAPNRDAAIKFLEYLAGDSAQQYFADGNNEWPVVPSVKIANPALTSFGLLKYDAVNVGALGKNQPLAQKIYDRVGWK